MKKLNRRTLFVLLIVSALFLTGTALASVNGFYSGYPIAKVKVNGSIVEGDTPAILFNGRTMVPLAFVGNAMGANVSWDSLSETAMVTTTQNYPSSTNHEDIEKLKLYAELARYYEALNLISSNLDNHHKDLMLSVVAYGQNKDYSIYLKTMAEFNSTVNAINYAKQNNYKLVDKASAMRVDVSNTWTILANYDSAVIIFKSIASEVDNAMRNYPFYSPVPDTNKSALYREFGTKARNESLKSSNYYFDMIRNY